MKSINTTKAMNAIKPISMYVISAVLLLGILPSRGNAQAAAANSSATFSASVMPPAETTPQQPRLTIGGGDLLEIAVFDIPEMAQQVRVSDAGDATFNLIGAVHVASMTTDQAREAIAKKLRDGQFILNPQVSLLIREYGTQGVSILGEVHHPGVYQVLGNRTLIDVLSEAGGTTPVAGPFATVKRHSDGSELKIPISRNPQDSLTSDVELQPGDKVLIPRANLVYVIGEVSRPGAFIMQNDGRMTALQALAFAGGNTRTAALNRVVLVRKSDAGRTQREISMKQMIHSHQADFELQADDILYIPNSTVKSVIYHGVPNIVQAATDAAIYSAMP